MPEGSGSAYEKVDRRAGDWAVVAAGASISLRDGRDQAGRDRASRRRCGVTCEEAEALADREPPSEELFGARGAAGRAASRPVTDQRGSAEYKRHVAAVLTERALGRATARARWEARLMQVTVTVNDREYTREIEPRMLLVHFLRDDSG